MEDALQKNLDNITEVVRRTIEEMRVEKTSRLMLEDNKAYFRQEEGSSGEEVSVFLIDIYGGLNGWGNWALYYRDLSELMLRLSSYFQVWTVDLAVDVADDVFTLTLGIKPLG